MTVHAGIVLHYVNLGTSYLLNNHPYSKVHGANVGPTWGRQDPGRPHVGLMNFVIWAGQWMKICHMAWQHEICFYTKLELRFHGKHYFYEYYAIRKSDMLLKTKYTICKYMMPNKSDAAPTIKQMQAMKTQSISLWNLSLWYIMHIVVPGNTSVDRTPVTHWDN